MNHQTLTAGDVGFSFGGEKPEGILSFLASRSKSSARTLAPSVSDVFKGCADEVTRILRTAIEARSKAEYRHEFDRLFPKYVALTLAMSHFAGAVVPKDDLERLTRESICEMEADFRDKGLNAFGSSVRDQAIFTVWTLRKISDVVGQIVAAKLDVKNIKEDKENCAQFNLNALLAQFSLDCLNVALDREHPVYPEVLEEFVEGLRSMVDAYAHARRGLELRTAVKDVALHAVSMDDEDREWLEVALIESSTFGEEGM
ncbi:MAG TPA: hypothetical protein VGK22_01705 [Candidatus Angelobacter sp.]|jgi:hypothetical protein